MKVIFLKDVPRAGRRHDVKEVNDGYAVNFLFPRKLAEPATPKALADLEQNKKEIIIEREVQESLLLKNLEEIKSKTITLKVKADEKGHLFSAIHKKEIVAELQSQYRAEIGENYIILEKPIKTIGEFEIPIEILVPSSAGKKQRSSFKLIVEKI